MSDHELSLYQCDAIIKQIEALAEQNEGEISDEQMETLVKAQTQSLAKLGNFCGYLKYGEGLIALCKAEEERIAKRRKQMERRLAQAKGYLLPYVIEQKAKLGRPIDVGTHRLSTRRSERVIIEDQESWNKGCFPNLSARKVTFTPIKDLVKQHLTEKGSHPGARLEQHVSLILT